MKPVNPAYVDELKELLKKSPYPTHMSMEIETIDIDRADIIMDLGNCHLQPFGIVHGGVISTIVDTATFWAGFLRIPADAGLVNIDLKVNYLKAVKTGRLTAKGVCMKPGRTISYATAEVFDEENTLIAHGSSSLMVLPEKGLKLSAEKFIER